MAILALLVIVGLVWCYCTGNTIHTHHAHNLCRRENAAILARGGEPAHFPGPRKMVSRGASRVGKVG